jgi:glycosyltransferase involved in cell wall biosynthesis
MHNEEACVEEFVRRTDAALGAMGRSYEIIVVSDGSTDRTEEIVRKLHEQHPALRGVFLARNGGQCTALYAGIQESRGDVVVVMDGDLQHLPEEIHLLVERMDDGTALVSGSRTGRTESLVLRRLPSRLANAMLRRVSGCPIRDMGGFKAIRGDVARGLRLRPGHHRLLPALAVARDPDGLGISQRRITISTVGLPPAIDRLVELDAGYNLAVSLHAADDELRTRLVPVNKAIGLDAVMTAADRYWEASGRRLTFEYVLLGEVNDSQADAERLARLLGGRAALVNVIPYNPVAGMPWKEPSRQAVERFLDVLAAAGVNVQVRRRKGARIDAACGQLRRMAAAQLK